MGDGARAPAGAVSAGVSVESIAFTGPDGATMWLAFVVVERHDVLDFRSRRRQTLTTSCLHFSSPAQQRRLAEYPPDWRTRSQLALRELCAEAESCDD